jgi:hypothetical protein
LQLTLGLLFIYFYFYVVGSFRNHMFYLSFFNVSLCIFYIWFCQRNSHWSTSYSKPYSEFHVFLSHKGPWKYLREILFNIYEIEYFRQTCYITSAMYVFKTRCCCLKKSFYFHFKFFNFITYISLNNVYISQTKGV